MRRSFVLKILFFAGLCWYLSGPLVEMFDFWDSPSDEMGDIASSLSGTLIWVAAGVCTGMFLFRKMRAICACLTTLKFGLVVQKTSQPTVRTKPPQSIPILDTSPLRI